MALSGTIATVETAGTPHTFCAACTLRILVVDPDSDMRALYRESFPAHEIVEAEDGREALTEALVRPPALVITEVTLPFIDGYALCTILRRHSATPAVPILVVTGDVRLGDLDRARTAGADAVLVKPTTPARVLAESRRLLEGGRDASGVPSAAAPELGLRRELADKRRVRLSKAFARFVTSMPPVPPPQLVCPSCDAPLIYEHSHVGGVNAQHSEQWDQYVCAESCGMFEYRQRTRKLTPIA